MMKKHEQSSENKITKKDLNKALLRSQAVQFSHNYERMQSLGTLYIMTPILKKLYKNKTLEQRVNCQRRHLEFFNSHPMLVPFIIGITAALEENTQEDEKDSVIAVKTSMMGPLAGLGDSLLNFTWFPIAGSIGASFGVEGNFLGPILMFVLINALYWPLKYYGIHLGYNKGREILKSDDGKKILDRITTSANVIGVMVAGALITNVVKLNLAIEIGKGDNAINIQQMIDKVIPNMLPMLMTLACLFFLKKFKGKYIVSLIFAIIIISIILSSLGILA